MLLLVGLGNPGDKYASNRHNIGFMAVDVVHTRWRFPPWRKNFQALVAEGTIDGERVLLMKPQTFMNLSGEAVREAAKFYKVAPQDIIAIHDDLDLPAGRLRIRERGGAGGHKGIQSMIVQLGTDAFVRVKFGIGRPPAEWDTADYVLGRFSPEEQPIISQTIGLAADAVEAILAEGTSAAMNRFNRQGE